MCNNTLTQIEYCYNYQVVTAQRDVYLSTIAPKERDQETWLCTTIVIYTAQSIQPGLRNCISTTIQGSSNTWCFTHTHQRNQRNWWLQSEVLTSAFKHYVFLSVCMLLSVKQTGYICSVCLNVNVHQTNWVCSDTCTAVPSAQSPPWQKRLPNTIRGQVSSPESNLKISQSVGE